MDQLAQRNAAIAEAYETGRSLRELGGEFGISHEAVRQVLRRKGVPMRPPGGNYGGSRADEERDNAITVSYLTGMTVKEAAIAHGVHQNTVSAALMRRGVKTRPRYDPERDQRIGDAYLAGSTLAEAGAANGVSAPTASAALVRLGIPPRRRTHKRREGG